MRVFLSYRRSDSAESTGRLFDRLVKAFGRKNIFKDVDSIPIKIRFSDFITSWIKNTDIFIVVIGKNWLTEFDANGNRRLDNADDFVRLEIVTALTLDIPIVPVAVMNSQFPTETELPEALRPLCEWNGERVRPDPDFHKDVDRLILKLRMLSAKRNRPKSSVLASFLVFVIFMSYLAAIVFSVAAFAEFRAAADFGINDDLFFNAGAELFQRNAIISTLLALILGISATSISIWSWKKKRIWRPSFLVGWRKQE
jgi:hypothetical protein